MTERTYVWDKFVRTFHWSLVILFIVSYLTGEDESDLHVYSGYAIVILLIARIAWGFIGTQHARFTDFVRSPKTVIDYSKSLLSGTPSHYPGHNPLGGLMILALMATLLLVTFSGMKLYAVEEGKGPLANTGSAIVLNQAYADDDDDDEYGEDDESEEFWEEVHEAAVNFMLLLIVLHIAGVIISSRLEGESLVKAMLTGYKNR